MNEKCEPVSFADFDRCYNSIVKEIGIKEDGTIASHSLEPTITVMVDDPDDDSDYEIVGLEPDMLWGCMCWAGVVIKIRRVED